MEMKVRIDGMTCEHCERAVARALALVPGVDRVIEVSRHRGEALLEGNPGADELVAAVRQEGYEAQVVG